MMKIKYLIACSLVFLGINYYKENIYNEEIKKEVPVVNISNSQKASIDNFINIRIGESEDSALSKIGSPKRVDLSEYGFYWNVYNQYKGKFAMVGIQNNKVVALYSNSLLSNEIEEIDFDKDSNFVKENYKILSYKKKGNTRFLIESKGEYDILSLNQKYVTIFYDLHNENKITSYQIIDEKIENSTNNIYPHYSDELKNSFENQIIDLTNSVRDRENLNNVVFSEKAQISSFKHSEDMANNNFFDHKNLKNQSPFDRMKKEGIIYSLAGENIAAGQISAIFAHEAWMNSKGHRENILNDFNYLGVGVSFGGKYKIYYTQNFYKK